MTLSTSTDHRVIADLLDRTLEREPVRGTLFGTIRISLGDTAWIAWDRDAVAVRSEAKWPVAVGAGWDERGLDELGLALAGVDALHGLSGVPETVDALVARPSAAPVTRVDQRLYRLDTSLRRTSPARRCSPVRCTGS